MKNVAAVRRLRKRPSQNSLSENKKKTNKSNKVEKKKKQQNKKGTISAALRKKLLHTYYNAKDASSYGGVKRLSKKLRTNPLKVKQWLSGQDAYTLHKPVRYKFLRRPVRAVGYCQQWQADLVDLSRISKENNNYKFLLTVIDVFSKKAWVIPLKSKKGQDILKAFESIPDPPPLYLHTDKGTEFINVFLKKWLKTNGVEFFHTENEDIKASVVERFNRTLKSKMWRYFTKNNTLKYIDILPDMVEAYNNTLHRSIGTSPLQVNDETSADVWSRLYGPNVPVLSRFLSLKKGDPKIGDSVCISKARRRFKKGYLPQWTEEIFTVEEIQNTEPVTFVIKDFSGERIRGSFYREELQKIDKKDDVYRIEKVLKREKNRLFVKWLGYPHTFNSWIDIKNVVGL